MCASSPKHSAPEGSTSGPRGRREVDCVLLHADWVVTCNEEMLCIPSGAVAIDGDTLAAVGPTTEIQANFRGRREMDLRGHLLMPGLVNAHTHAAMSCFRGLGSDLPLMQWLHEVIFPVEATHINPETVYWGSLLSAVEMLKNGITTFCDGYFYEESVARAAMESGIRAVLGQGIVDFPSPDLPDPGRARERAEAFLAAFPGDTDRLRPSLFCHAPYTCGAGTLQWVKSLCRERNILFQIHLSETAGEVLELTEKKGMRPVFYLDTLGILDDLTLCAHAVWLTPAEMELLALRRVGISHNVESNMKLASGVAQVPQLLTSGVAVGLGTDGCASNNDLDLFSEMDKASKLQKVFAKDPTVFPAWKVLRLATCEGASVLGWGREIGSLEPGKKADLIAIDLNQPHLTPLYNPVSQLVYTVRGSDVRHVWVGGRHVVSDGRVKDVNEAQVMKEVGRIAFRVKKETCLPIHG
ncbi:MAG: amidohydrolase [Deltaproteobacteria bacterium]|nr:amidohydrolase [Deltaproteobacteria bacterium]